MYELVLVLQGFCTIKLAIKSHLSIGYDIYTLTTLTPYAKHVCFQGSSKATGHRSFDAHIRVPSQRTLCRMSSKTQLPVSFLSTRCQAKPSCVREIGNKAQVVSKQPPRYVNSRGMSSQQALKMTPNHHHQPRVFDCSDWWTFFDVTVRPYPKRSNEVTSSEFINLGSPPQLTQRHVINTQHGDPHNVSEGCLLTTITRMQNKDIKNNNNQ